MKRPLGNGGVALAVLLCDSTNSVSVNKQKFIRL